MSTNLWNENDKIELYQEFIKEGPCWSKIASKLNSTPDAVRSVFRRNDWKEFINKNDEKIKSGLDDISLIRYQQIKKDNHVENLINAKKDSIIKEIDLRQIKEELKNVAEENIISDKLFSAIQKIEKINYDDISSYSVNTNHSVGPQEASLLISDAHVGLAVAPEEVGYIGKYNYSLFKYRLENLLKKVIKISELHRKNHQLDSLNIMFLGDMVHGSNDVGKWGFLHTEQTVIDQVFNSTNEFTKFILILKRYFKNIKISGVVGNHGRVGKKGTEKKYSNWDYLIYKTIESRLENQENISFDIPKTGFHVHEIMGQKFLMMHGDTIKRYLGIPWYGITRAESKYRSLIEHSKNIHELSDLINKNKISDPEAIAQISLLYSKPFHFLVLGHFHHNGDIETGSGGRVIMNSSFCGGDDYSINDLITSNIPSQKFFGVNKDGKTWSYDLDLDREC